MPGLSIKHRVRVRELGDRICRLLLNNRKKEIESAKNDESWAIQYTAYLAEKDAQEIADHQQKAKSEHSASETDAE